MHIIMTDGNGNKWLVNSPDELREEFASIERDDKSLVNWGNFKTNSIYFAGNGKRYNVEFVGRNEIKLNLQRETA